MALAAATYWEVRGGSGSDTNGGGFAGNGSLAAPAAPSLATTTGGTLTVATWYIVISYVYYNGSTAYSGPKSAETSIVIPNATNDAIIVTSPAASAGATHYRVWGVASTSGGPYWPLGSTTGTAIGTNVTITTPVTSGIQCPGVDYSQQAAAQVDIDAATITTSVTGAVVTFTAGYTPSANDVGNQVRLNGGTGVTLGYRQIIAWTATTWTVDASIVAGPITDMTAKMGGALNTISSQTTTTMPASLVAGNRIWVKSATYAETWTHTVSSSGRNMIVYMGYTATRGDACFGTDRPLIDGGSARTNCAVFSGIAWIMNFRFASSTAAAFTSSSGSTWVYNCKFSGAGTIGFNGAGTRYLLIGCEISGNTTGGVNQAQSQECIVLWSCYVHNNGTFGFGSSNGDARITAYFCVFDTNGSHGIGSSQVIAVNCTSYGNTTDGFLWDGNISTSIFNLAFNCISDSNSGFGYRTSTASSAYVLNCQASNNSSGPYSNIPVFTTFNTNSPGFVNAPAGNFQVGADMWNAGIAIDVNDGLAADGYLDLGAVQKSSTIGGGLLVHPGMSGGARG